MPTPENTPQGLTAEILRNATERIYRGENVFWDIEQRAWNLGPQNEETPQVMPETPQDAFIEQVQEEFENYQFNDDSYFDDPFNRVEEGLWAVDWEVAERVRAQLIARNMLKRCTYCDNLYAYWRIQRNRWCDECNRGTSTCIVCGTLTRDTDSCPNCENTYINQYNHQPRIKPRLTEYDEKIPPHKRLLIGVELELEIENKLKLARTLDEQFTWAYLKHDGSLTHGFEIVTHPFTETWFQNNKEEFQKLFSLIRDFYGVAESSCGTHLHLSKTAFSAHHLYKFMALFYENKEETIKISRRKNYRQIERFAAFENTSKKNLIRKAKHFSNIEANLERGNDKYIAINCRNPNTVELRFFAGADNISDFLSSYEATLGAFHFTKDTGRKDITWPNFTRWVFQNRKTYPNLYTLAFNQNDLF